MQTKISRIAVVLLLIAGWNIPPASGRPAPLISPVSLFNAGLYTGLLRTAMNASVSKGSWSSRAVTAAAEFTAAYSLAPPASPPEINQVTDVDYWFQKVQMYVVDVSGSSTDNCSLVALRILMAGYHLGRAGIGAELGTCPLCVRDEMLSAANQLREIASCVASATSASNSLTATARSIGQREPADRFAAFSSAITSAVESIQSALSGIAPTTPPPAVSSSSAMPPLNSVWRTTQTHMVRGVQQKVYEVGLVVEVASGNRMTMHLAMPHDEYTLEGEMKGNVFNFAIRRRGGHHGSGLFTFTGNSFEGRWSDDFGNAGTWRGQRAR
ncbi:MAG TPA: hypothetical protein VFV34_22420 [Blastocatellia bacterium]|nr:hypothetical protein [Blastocatellia bacterium]